MQYRAPNPSLSPWLRAFFVLVGVIVIFGSGLLWLPNHVRPHWVWPITPFNSAFLGGIYLSELLTVIVIITVNRWAPSRVTLPMALAFTFVVSAVTLGYLDRLDYAKVATYAWFVTYFGAVIVTAFFLWKYRHLPPVDGTPVPPGWSLLLIVQGTAVGLYGLCMLMIPKTSTRLWPWPIDAFHGRMYSAVFLSACTGALLLTRAMAPIETVTYGLTQTSFALFSIVGLVITNRSLHRVVWTATGTRVWLAGFALLFVAGAALIVRGIGATTASRLSGEAAPPQPAPST